MYATFSASKRRLLLCDLCVVSAEFGDFDPQQHGSDYLCECHLLPKVVTSGVLVAQIAVLDD